MKEKFISKSINFINKYENCNDLKLIKLKYGLEGIYNLIIKMVVVFIIALLSKTMAITSLFLLFYAGIRTYSFGWHAKTSLGCWITTILIYNVIPIIFGNLTIPKIAGYIILLMAVLSMLIWAPADTPKRPLIHADKRMQAKKISVFISIIYILIYTISKNSLINNALIYATLIQTILINPLIYKITNTRFNNYKYYKKNI